MLFAAGMGIGLMFWGVAEPVAYFTGWYETPLNVEPNTPEAARLALGATMYHWGLHPWAIYTLVGLSLAFFTYNKGLPLSIRSIFYPILGDKTWGWPGHIIDILAVLATLFGLATSLGLGAQQAASGINHVFGIESGIGLQIAVIVVVTALAVFSVVRGLDKGVRVLSKVNMFIAFILLIFVIFAGFAIDQVTNGIGALGTDGLTEVPLAMFQMFDQLPMSSVLSVIAIILVLVFFITSSDSGSLVIDSITSGGKIDAPIPQRIFWAVTEGLIAMALLWIGGTEAIQALQAGAISTALPFTFVLLLMCVSLLKGLRTEKQ